MQSVMVTVEFALFVAIIVITGMWKVPSERLHKCAISSVTFLNFQN